MTEPLLSVRNLSKEYAGRAPGLFRAAPPVKVVRDVSFDVGVGEVLGLAGESGSGKTTIGRSILRLVEPSAGQVLFRGTDIRGYGRRELRRFRSDAQIVFQDPYSSLDPRMTIEQIICEPLIIQKKGRTAAERRARAAELLGMVALPDDFLGRMPHELSGGQRQRVGIARALAVDPAFIVADEPVSALDVSVQAQVVNLVADLRARLGLAMLFISHDLAVMQYLSDRIAVLYLGRLVEIGPAREICANPRHPYSQALLSAVPEPDPALRRSRIVLQGEIPSPADPPSGCVFRTRCPKAISDCARVTPVLAPVGTGHQAACIRL
jgi:oligopeptide transport system ATP-binding protein